MVLEITCEYKLSMFWCIAGNLAGSEDHKSIWDSCGGSLSSQTQEEKNCNRFQALGHSYASTQTELGFLNIIWLKWVLTHLKDRKVRNRLNEKHNPTQLQWSWDKKPFSVMVPWTAIFFFSWLIPSVQNWLYWVGFFVWLGFLGLGVFWGCLGLFSLWVICNGSKDPDQAPNIASNWYNSWRS